MKTQISYSTQLLRARPFGGRLAHLLRTAALLLPVAGLLSLGLLGGALFSPTAADAQTFTATVTGTVTDASGAVLPGAKVELRNTGTSDARQVLADAEGRFTIPQLMPGTYSLTVMATGFKSFVLGSIQLQGSQTAEYDAKLELGSSEQSVEVTASDVAIDTQTASRVVTLDENEVLNLPTSFRNPLYVVHSTAGVVAVRTGLSAYTTDQNQNRFSLNGGRDESASILVDGASIVAPDLGGAIATPTQDATSEVQVQRTAYDAQFTHTDGGVVSLITKSGTNQFHGSAFEYFRNDHLDANSWDNNRVAIARPLYQRNQFGGSIGGPILKDKLFIFGAYEGLRLGYPNTFVGTVPTALERTGDFSQSYNSDGSLAVIYNPFTTVANSSSSTGYSRTAFDGNKIPADLISAVGKAAAALYPLPNTTGVTGGGNNYASSAKVVSNYDKFDIRGDYVVNAKDSVFARVTKAWQLNSGAAVYKTAGEFWGGENDFRWEAIAGDTWVPNPKWVVNTLVSYGNWVEQDTTPSTGLAGTIGLPAATVNGFQSTALPQFNVENFSQIGYSGYADTPHITTGIQLNISREFSGHSLKFGVSGELQRLYPANTTSANFNFTRGLTSGSDAQTDSTITGNSVASLLLGAGASGNSPYQAKLDLQQKNWGLYIQDAWRVNSRLTVNAGVRYDVQGARNERFNRLNNFDETVASPLAASTGLPITGGLVFATKSRRGLWDTSYLNFDPRISVAYKVLPRLVFRAGYGIFNPAVYAYSSDAQQSSDGYSSDTVWNSTVGNSGLVPQDLVDNPFPDGFTQPAGSSNGLLTQVGQTVDATLRRHPTPYVQVYSADFQWQLSTKGVFELGYAGTQGRQLLHGVFIDYDQLPSSYLSLGSTTLNQSVTNPFAGVITSGALSGSTIPYWRTLVKYPQFTGVNVLADTPGSSSHFNALTAKYNQHLASGLDLLLTYQWSKAIDNTSENNSWEVSDARRDAFNAQVDRSISAHDIPQDFVGTVLWKLPFGRGQMFGSNMSRFADELFGGWQISNILRLATSRPLAFTANNDLGTYNYKVTRPNVTSVAAIGQGKKSIGQWFNTAAFSTLGTAGIGNIPRYVGVARPAPTRDADVAIEKYFPLWRESTLQFRAEAYNVSNTPQYGRPDTNYGDSNFGAVTSTTNVGPRTLQFGARIQF